MNVYTRLDENGLEAKVVRTELDVRSGKTISTVLNKSEHAKEVSNIECIHILLHPPFPLHNR